MCCGAKKVSYGFFQNLIKNYMLHLHIAVKRKCLGAFFALA